MRMTRPLLLAALLALAPSSAHAGDRSWWAWLEELSGPGYFTGYMQTFDLGCVGSTEPRCGNYQAPAADRGVRLKSTVSVTGGFLTSGSRPRFNDVKPEQDPDQINHAPVHVIPAYLTWRFRTHRSIDIGPGVGGVFFSGKSVDVRAAVILIPVSVSWKPALTKAAWPNTRARNAISLDFEAYYFTRGFSGSSFGVPSTAYKSSPHLQGVIGISFDLGDTIYRK